jgi:glycosyltransferase involved in cell wall biosynthesis
VPNEEIREALTRAHIFAYPCTVLETFCIAAVEAMSAGCLVVCPDVAALVETVSRYGLVYRWTEDAAEHRDRFAATLAAAIDMVEKGTAVDLLTSAQRRVTDQYSWDTRIVEWTRMLEGLLEDHRRRG